MSDTGSRITQAEVIDEVLARTGVRVTQHQLKYWRRLGVIARPRQDFFEHRFASQTTYPVGTEVVVGALAARHSRRSLHELVRIAWEHQRPLSEMRPALQELLSRAERPFRTQFDLWPASGKRSAIARAKQSRRHTKQIHQRHRSIAAHIAATIMFSRDPETGRQPVDAGAALWDALPRKRWRMESLKTDFSEAVGVLAREASFAQVSATLTSASDAELDRAGNRMWRAWRVATRLGAVSGDESWFPFFLLVFIGSVVSSSLSRELHSLDASDGSPIAKLAGAVKHLAFEEIMREISDAGPLTETFESDDLPPEFARHVD